MALSVGDVIPMILEKCGSYFGTPCFAVGLIHHIQIHAMASEEHLSDNNFKNYQENVS